MGLYKTTVEIWTDYDPTGEMELSDLAREAESGNGICTKCSAEEVKNVGSNGDIPEAVVSFFDIEQDEITTLLRDIPDD